MSWWSFHPLCTPVFHWNSPLEQKGKVTQYKPQHSIPCAGPCALRHGRSCEPSRRWWSRPMAQEGSYSPLLPLHEQAGRRMRSHSSLFQAGSELVTLVTHQWIDTSAKTALEEKPPAAEHSRCPERVIREAATAGDKSAPWHLLCFVLGSFTSYTWIIPGNPGSAQWDSPCISRAVCLQTSGHYSQRASNNKF